MSHTYATLEVSRATYDEIADKLRAAGHTHAFVDSVEPSIIDLHGIGLFPDAGPRLCFVCGRTPHAVNDPQCMAANKPIAEQLSWALGEIQRLRAAPDNTSPHNLTPDSTILKQVDGQWQKLALFLLYKLAGRTQVRISVAEIQQCSADFAPGVPVMYTHGHQDGISFQVVDEAAARRLAAHDQTMRGHA